MTDARTPTDEPDSRTGADLDEETLRAGCTRFLGGHGRRDTAALLAELGEAVEADTYGKGGAVTQLEDEVADLLDLEAAAFFPSGTMAQQIALRLHAEASGCRTVGWHPTSHLALHELGAAERLHGLVPRALGDAQRLLTAADVSAVAEPMAAVLFELPQREIGGRLPDFDDLLEQIAAARNAGAAVHLDGARLWEAGAGYRRPYPEIAGLFDTVYVSFYKGLGGLSGCCLLGADDLIAEAREWRSRHGGTLFALWPYAAAARAGLALRLPRMPAYLSHAREIAAALSTLPGVEVVPDPPQTSMMHIHLQTPEAGFNAALRRLAAEEKIWAWSRCYPTDTPSRQRVELSVGDATLEWSAAAVAQLVAGLLEQAKDAAGPR